MVSRLLILFYIIFFSFLNASSNLLYDASIEQEGFVLKFNKPVGKVRFFRLKKDTIKYVFDFYNTRLKSSSIDRGLSYEKPIDKIKISQYKSSVVRVVIETVRSYRPKKYRSGNSRNRYIISLPKSSKPLTQIGNRVKNLFSSIGSGSSSSSSDVIRYDSSSKKRYTIILDPGHGGMDVGAISPENHKYREKDIALSIALKTKKYLQRKGFRVLMTRSSDKYVKLLRRTHFANLKRGDLFVSIHANSIKGSRRKRSKVRGIETYYLSPADSKRAKEVAAKENSVEFDKKYKESMRLFLNTLTHSKIILSHKLAMDIQSMTIQSLRKRYRGVVNGGAKPAIFWVLVGAEMPAVLIETGYISNPSERRRLFNKSYQERLAKGIAIGVARFLKNREREME